MVEQWIDSLQYKKFMTFYQVPKQWTRVGMNEDQCIKYYNKELLLFLREIGISIPYKHSSMLEIFNRLDTPMELIDVLYSKLYVLKYYDMIRKRKSLSLEYTLKIIQTISKHEKLIEKFKKNKPLEVMEHWNILIQKVKVIEELASKSTDTVYSPFL